MKQRFWTKFVATIMSLATTLSIVSVPAAVPLASQVPATQQVDQEAERSAAEQVLHTLSEQTQPMTAKASDRTSVPNRSLGVDVSSYQGTDMSGYARAGAKFCIVKTTEGTGWVNSKAAAQIRSAKANGMMVMGYHFAHCGGSVSNARNEANYAVSHARSMGVPVHSYIAMDFETDAWGSRQANTDAAVAFMQTVRNAGYLPLFYSGSAYMNAHFDTNQIVQKFPGSLWVASYKVLGRQDSPDFDYFPSRNGIAIWQFTDNLKGMGVDGSINVLPLSFLQPAPQPQPQPKPQPKPKPNPTYQTKIHFLDSQAGNREVSSQTVSGHQGDRRSYSVPENYHANSGQSNQVTISNNGSVSVYVSHNTETVHQNRSVTRRVLGTLTSSDGTTGSYEYSQTKQVPVTGIRDAVTGKTDWTAVPDFNQIFGEYHPDFAADAAKSKFSYSSQFDHAVLDHVDRSAPAGSSTETIHVYWKAAAAKKPASALSASSSASHHASSASSSASHRASSSASASSSSSSASSASSSRTSSSSASSSSASSSSASVSSTSSSSDAQAVRPENAVVASARRTVKFEFADGTTKTVVQIAMCRADSDGLIDFGGWGMINVPVRQGEVADCSQVPAVSNARELQTYWNSAFSKTHQTSRNQYDQTVVIKYAQNQTSKPQQPAKLSRHGSSRADASAGDSQMGTAARKELQELMKNPAAGSRAENMSHAQAQKYVQARHDATPMSASYNGSPAKQDRHNYVGDLPQTGDAHARMLQLAAGAAVLICLSAAVTAAVMIDRRRRQQSK